MSKSKIVINKRFAKVEVACESKEVRCYWLDTDRDPVSLAEYIGYAIDTTKGRGRCVGGVCVLENVHLVLAADKTTGPEHGEG